MLLSMAMTTLSLETAMLDRASVRDLRAHLLGSAIEPAEAAYDTARQVWNTAYDRRPALVIRAADAGDVQQAIRFARERRLPLAVRSGGHSMVGHGTVDAGIVLDLGGLTAIDVDPHRRRVWAQPGVTSNLLGTTLHRYGLVLSTGDSGTVALGGLTLGGGMGWLVRKYGLTIDHLESVEIVTAEGELISASAQEHPDLFWALRGGGGNFGVATGFTFHVPEVRAVYGGALVLPARRDVLEGYLALAHAAPNDLSTIGFLMRVPPAPFIAPAHHGTLALIVYACFDGDAEHGAPVLAPFRALGEPLADTLAPMPYPAMFHLTAAGSIPNSWYLRSGLFHTLSTPAIDAMLEAMHATSNPRAFAEVRVIGGAMAAVAPDATAFAHRDKTICLFVTSAWEAAAGGGEESQARERKWVDQLWRQLAPESSGVYANFLGEEGEAGIGRAYPADTYRRLVRVKRRYDPENVFRLNQNVRPDA
jgi:FAD/FMN-containing dehydrogenase